jgi:hypothetical protein
LVDEVFITEQNALRVKKSLGFDCLWLRKTGDGGFYIAAGVVAVVYNNAFITQATTRTYDELAAVPATWRLVFFFNTIGLESLLFEGVRLIIFSWQLRLI